MTRTDVSALIKNGAELIELQNKHKDLIKECGTVALQGVYISAESLSTEIIRDMRKLKYKYYNCEKQSNWNDYYFIKEA